MTIRGISLLGRRRNWWVAGVTLAIGVFAGGCGASDAHHLIGVVTTVSPNLCVGKTAAEGICVEASPSIITSVTVGECVEVTYARKRANGTDGTASAVEKSTAC